MFLGLWRAPEATLCWFVWKAFLHGSCEVHEQWPCCSHGLGGLECGQDRPCHAWRNKPQRLCSRNDSGRFLHSGENFKSSSWCTEKIIFLLRFQVGRNVCHGSDSVESAKKEIALWFKEDDLVSWSPAQVSWVYEDWSFFWNVTGKERPKFLNKIMLIFIN